MIWLVLGVILLVAVAILVWPFLRPASPERRHIDQSLDVYRQQLDEIATDSARGTISRSDAESMEIEIKRRMLRLGRTAERTGKAVRDDRRYRPLAVALIIAVPVVSLGLYAALGSPDQPSRPLAARDIAAERMALQQQSGAALVQRLVDALKAQPENLDGWVALATTLSRMEQYEQAAETYLKATILAPNAAELFVSAGENFYFAAGGHVTDAAASAFEKARAIDAAHPGARYYLALRAAEQGEMSAALDQWIALYEDSPADAPFMPILKNRIEQAAEELGRDVSAVFAVKTPTERPRGPTSEDMANAAGMTAQERQEMITAMVEGLAVRMAETPDYDGLMRLAEAYRVLGKDAEAADAFARAREERPDDIAALAGEAFAHVRAEGAGGVPPASAVRLYRELLTKDPDHPEALWYLGVAEATAGNEQAARGLWTRLQAATAVDDPLHAAAGEAIKNLPEVAKN